MSIAAGRPPPVDELLALRRAAEVLGDDAIALAHEHRRCTVATTGFVATSGQTGADVGRNDQRRPGTVQRGAQSADGRALRATEVEGGHIVVQPQGLVDGGGVRLVDVGRRH